MPQTYNWSRFYIGANAGYGWSSQCIDITAINGIDGNFAEGCKSAGGGLIGGQFGYRWQAGPWVFGLEAQVDWANLQIRPTRSSTRNGLGLFAGQIGYAANDVLFYVKGGATVGSQSFGLYSTVAGTGLAYAECTLRGGVVGAGLEYGIAPNWAVGVEYDYLWRGQRQQRPGNAASGACSDVHQHRRQHGHAVDQLQLWWTRGGQILNQTSTG